MPTNRETTKPNGAGNGRATDAHGVIGTIQHRVTTRVDEQKNRAADGLGGIAEVFRHAGSELRNENETIASYVDMASDQLRGFAEHIRQKGVTEMMDDLHRFARRRPALFIGGAFLAGIGIARFLKASAERGEAPDFGGGFSSVDPMTANPDSAF